MNLDREIIECRKRLKKLYAMISVEKNNLSILTMQKKNDEIEKEINNIELCNKYFGVKNLDDIISDFNILKKQIEIDDVF